MCSIKRLGRFVLFLVFVCMVFLPKETVAQENNITRYELLSVHASNHDGNVPENTLVDDLGTRWSAQGIGEWIQFDLGAAKEVGYIGVAFHSGDIRTSIVDVELSLDGNSWNKVVDRFESSGTSLNLEAIDFVDQEARYVRLTGYGNTVNQWNSITAVHVYGPIIGEPIVEELEQVDPGPVPDAEPFLKPGLISPDGTTYTPHSPNKVIGNTLNVLDFGANQEDNHMDDAWAIQAAIEAAEPGDEIYFPNGVYNLQDTMVNDGTSHFHLRSGINLRGESKEGVQLKSSFDMQETPNSKVMAAFGVENVYLSNLTITSTFDRAYSDNPSVSNPERGGPAYGIFIADYANRPSQKMTVSHVTVEKFQRMGIRIEKSNRIIVENALFRQGTDVGGGGAGYGVTIQGIQGIDRLGHANDTYFNVVRKSTFEGPYMRHGTLIQNYAHNNLIEENHYVANIHDAIDLHGQGEYLNEIKGNVLNDIHRGGIGVGNTGGTPPNSHSASGEGNYIHDNKLTDTRDGITVIMGSPGTVIEHNKIVNTTKPENAKGIFLLNAPRTVVRYNEITNNHSTNFWGIVLAEDPGDRNNEQKGAGIPQDVIIQDNRIENSSNGIRIEAGERISTYDNTFVNITGIDFISYIDLE